MEIELAENLGLLDKIIGLLTHIWNYIFPPKPKLCFEDQLFTHRSESFRHNYNMLKIRGRIFIINRGKKPTTIRNISIIRMIPDYLEHYEPSQPDSIRLLPGDENDFFHVFRFWRDTEKFPKPDEIQIDIEFRHSEGINIIHAVSKPRTQVLHHT